MMITNTGNTNPKYPETVVYIGQNSKVWSRPITEWKRSFTEVKHKYI